MAFGRITAGIGRGAGGMLLGLAVACAPPSPAVPGGTDEGGSTSPSDTTSTSGEPGTTVVAESTGEPPRDLPEDPPPPLPPDLGPGTVPPPPGSHFVDVTVEAGLDLDPGQFLIPPFCALDSIVGVPGETGDYCLPERFLGGAAVGDYDADGWPDLFLTRLDGPGRLLRNQGDGTFTDVTAQVGLQGPPLAGGAAWVDVDGDGDLDLVITAVGDALHHLYVSDGRGGFDEQGLDRGIGLPTGLVRVGTSIAAGDYDLDGYVDLFVADWRSSTVLGERVDHNRLLHNLGADAPGYFEDVTEAMGIDLQTLADELGAPPGAWGFSPAFVDLDGDHWPELTLAADYGTSRLWWNDGAGGLVDTTFASGVGTDGNGMGSTFGDIDLDGDLDWFVSAIWSPTMTELGNRMYRNEGDRTFLDVTDAYGVREGGWGWGTALFDPDLDGDLDLVLTGGWPGTVFSADPIRLWTDVAGGGAWLDQASEHGLEFSRNGRGLVPLDYDRDGDLDLLVMANTEIPALFRNDVETGSWLEVRAQAGPGNSQGLGVEVRVQVGPGDPVLVRHIGVGSHYLGHAEAAAYFGLGDGDEPLHEVELYWPHTGQSMALGHVGRNQRLVVGP